MCTPQEYIYLDQNKFLLYTKKTKEKEGQKSVVLLHKINRIIIIEFEDVLLNDVSKATPNL